MVFEKVIRNTLHATGAVIGAMYGINKLAEYEATKNKLTIEKETNYYVWKHGDIFYKKKGEGSPVLLVHDLHPAASSYEWSKVFNSLAKTNTVYSIYLIGCGKSEKPDFNYVNYIFVQLINDFIKNIIGEPTSVIVTGDSFPAVVMASRMYPDNFSKIIAVNPENPVDSCITPDKDSKSKKNIIKTPIFGTFVYNAVANKKSMESLFKNQYYKDSNKISKKMIDIYTENAHLSGCAGKNLFASIVGNYTGINIIHAMKYITCPMEFIVTEGYDESALYLQYKPDIKVTTSDDCGYLPQMEKPGKFIQALA